VTTIQYDGINRPTFFGYGTQAGPTYQSTVTNTYDAGNRLTGVTDTTSGTISRSYDGLDQVLTETTPQGLVTYTYDADERRKTMTVAGQPAVNYTFNNASRLTGIVQSSSNVAFSYDGDGRRTALALPNGVVATYSYDAASQLTGIVYQGGALAPANLAYSYDLDGRRVGVSGSLATTQLPAAVSSAVYNANNQLTQWGSTAMTYDLNGNTLNDGTNSYTWDTRNRLVSADSNAASFAYDPFGRRVGKTLLAGSTNFLYDGANPVQELSGSTVTANLLTGGLDERFLRTTATETDDFLTDALGSTVVLTGATGSSEAEYSYAPFGSMGITGSTTNSYNYTGRETDGLGINYYRARYYNPAIGRFLSEDPLGFAGGGTNLYAYAGNNPISFRDSFGLKPGPPLKCTGHGTGCHASNQLFSPSLLALIIGTEIIGLGPEDPFADAAVAGEIAAAEEAAGTAAEAASASEFGTTAFGNEIHQGFGDVLAEQTGTNIADWRMATAPGQTGVDATYVGDADLGFTNAELKPMGYSDSAVGNQISNWGLPEGQTSIWWYNSNGIIGQTLGVW
jgi:RHS repeat-associated protein